MKKSRCIDLVPALALFCAFAASVLLVLMTGVRVYRAAVDSSERRYTSRTAAEYIRTKARACDQAGALSLLSFGDGDALSFSCDGCDTVIYTFGGQLCELSVPSGDSLPPDAGDAIAPLSSLSAALDNGLLRVECRAADGSAQTVFISLTGGAGK